MLRLRGGIGASLDSDHVRCGRFLIGSLSIRSPPDQAIVVRRIGSIMNDHIRVEPFGPDSVRFAGTFGKDPRNLLQVIPNDAVLMRLDHLLIERTLRECLPGIRKPKQSRGGDEMQEQR
jgi:hypothetical protein